MADAEDDEVEQIDPRVLKPDLYEAAKRNDTAGVARLLLDQVPPTFVDTTNGWTVRFCWNAFLFLFCQPLSFPSFCPQPLHWAAKHGNIPMLKRLLEFGASEPYKRMVKERTKSLAAQVAGGKGASTKKAPPGEAGQQAGGEQGTAEDKDSGEPPKDGGDGGADAGGGGGDGDNSKAQSAPKTASATDVLAAALAHDEGEEDDVEKLLETSVDLLKNTPLLWAAVKGHLRGVWLLLLDGYSPNDVDSLGNNALHLAAVNGHLNVLKVLVDDGGMANVVNIYKNLPIDMATNKAVREVLATAMEKGASMTGRDVAAKHEQNVLMYNMHANNLASAVADALKTVDELSVRVVTTIPDVARRLSDALNDAKEWALEETVIEQGQKLLEKLEITQDLLTDAAALDAALPVRTQAVYTQHVHKLERSICRAEKVDADRFQLESSRTLIRRAQVEYSLSVLILRLKDVECAVDANEHDMNRLKEAVDKARGLGASADVVTEGDLLYQRLEAELSMSRAMLAIPTVKVPIESPPEGYWEECDLGKIEDGYEEYPLPPADNNGEYRWVPSEALSSLKNAIDSLKKSYVGADALGANPAVIAATKDKLAKAEKQMKLLQTKDDTDKAMALDAVAKLCKKLKKGKGKK